MKRWLLLLLALLLAACSNWDDPAVARAKRAATAKGDIVIGAVWPWKGPKGQLWEGMELAVAEINAAGGVLNRKLRIVREDDESSVAVGRQVAQKFADNPDMVAVIGHYNSYVAVPAAAIYEAAGLVYLTPQAVTYQLNSQGHNLVFRSFPSNRRIGPAMAEYMVKHGHRRVVILYSKDRQGQESVNYFEQAAREQGLQIADRRSYRQGTEDFRGLIQDWKDLYHFDVILYAGVMPEAAYFVRQARELGLSMPIVSQGGLDSMRYVEAAGKAADGSVVPEIFVQNEDWPPYRHLRDLFEKKYHRPVHTPAAQGYDAVHLIAHAMRRANSTVPAEVARALHTTRDWQGATGIFTFDEKGDLPDKAIGWKVVRDGKFVYLGEVK